MPVLPNAGAKKNQIIVIQKVLKVPFEVCSFLPLYKKEKERNQEGIEKEKGKKKEETEKNKNIKEIFAT